MTKANIQQWRLVGAWFDVCNCSIPCPCSFDQPATHGYCDGVLLWHIGEGYYGQTRLDGFNVAMLGSFSGSFNGEHEDSRAAVFFDERADDAQRGALQKIFTGQAGGWPQQYKEIFGAQIVASEVLPIDASIADDLATWHVRVGDHAEARAEALTGPTMAEGERVQVHNMPASEVGPGQPPATLGRATMDRADAFGFVWERSGNSSKVIPFDWTGPEPA
ncbi:hypothetical protein A8924_3002 [Saccharopolyspora erythraea NRRL 2338]|uniref:Uncharacterized protein n=2 Tax=Saccharopolyspora erythraea TaxID=1836 RepID=A4FCX3_SACEN|nr:DUF1326 domain-containing protein [Saccharopolyspora erythraea]EQD82536.1 hypothetical protein N599_30115 [Saccharopolyspora erythraea D]PFG95647.1 hypothetical protein A8924_3002 [Saccharopolyspora erythraea NRRL 2338]QRK92249.1 DUF1326 domain-containing protein [Saccharopolyspora erythraea]CAM01898.1 hypothetical protein SACE_2613 [Saccharopolyspora erythraea NRRL 2338]